jgi:maltose alpha-D-glucosyltransferase/alpha-amylase
MSALCLRLRTILLACAAFCCALPAARAASPSQPTSTHMPSWLEHTVFYQIYPQSFADSNGDGIGDIQGIISKLPYLRSLGITGIWLSPVYDSPFGDAGYDVADFYKVAPRYGSNDDLKQLFAEAKQAGIRIMMDLVAGHTSNQHPWFRQSQSARRNEYSDWYIWNNSQWDWYAPNTQFVVGAAERRANYVANFFYFQPALNYGYAQPDPKFPWQQSVDAPGPRAVRAELKKIMAYWFDLGASGFRVDMAGSLVKNDPDGKATAALWREFRAWMDQSYPDCALVSEWSQPAISIPQGFHMDFLLPYNRPGYVSLFRKTGPDSTPYFDTSGQGSIRTFLDEFEPLYTATKGQGFIAIPSGNHDTVPRLGNGRSPRGVIVAHAFLLTMPGVPFLYYGDELGLRSLDDLPTKEGGYERTGCRTPMLWDDSANAGFSTGPADRLYLPVDPAPDRPTVAREEKDPASPLHVVRELIALRKAHPALGASGDYATLASSPTGGIYAYARSNEGEHILVALNPTGATAEARLPAAVTATGVRTLAGNDGAFTRDAQGWKVTLPAESYAIVQAQ